MPPMDRPPKDRAADLRRIAEMVVHSMVNDGQPLIVEEIYEAILHTFRYETLDEALKQRLRAFVEKLVAKYAP